MAWAIACLIGFLTYWPAVHAWFQRDDFHWLTLPLLAKQGIPLQELLFKPMAQGTVRVLSERVYFLLLGAIADLSPLPFRICAFAVYGLLVWLVMRLGQRLSSSWLGGCVAAIVFAVSASNAPLLSWSSPFNQLLFGAFLVSGTLFLMRWLDFRRTSDCVFVWLAFAGGLLSNELMVVFPVIAFSLTFLVYRRVPRMIALMGLVSVLFALWHLVVISHDSSGPYRAEFGSMMAKPLLVYWYWSLGFGWLFHFQLIGRIGSLLATVALSTVFLGLIAVAVKNGRSRHILFAATWFPIVIFPLTPFTRHVTDYYPAIPFIGVALLAGCVASYFVYEANVPGGSALTLLWCAIVVIANMMSGREIVAWYGAQSHMARQFVEALQGVGLSHSEGCIVIREFDPQIYRAAIHDRPWHLIGMDRVYLSGRITGEVDQRLILPEGSCVGSPIYDFVGARFRQVGNVSASVVTPAALSRID